MGIFIFNLDMKKGISTPLVLFVLLLVGLAVGGGVLLLLFPKNEAQDSDAQNQTSVVDNVPVEKIVSKVFSSNSVPDAYKERYLDYTEEAFNSLMSNRRVIFFAASWCPTCQAANQAYLSKLSEIPEDVSVFIANYDEEIELKAKYNITYQHTFVQVDRNGNEITKWNGGDIAELLENLN